MSDRLETRLQGNRKFLRVTNNVWYVSEVNGRSYKGKGYMYFECNECKQLICHMMGGAARHYKMHEKQKQSKG